MNTSTTSSSNPAKGPTPRQGTRWWIVVIVLLVLAGILFVLGRSENGPGSAPVPDRSTRIAPRDQITNTSRAGQEEMPSIDRLNDDGPTVEELTIPANDPASKEEPIHIGTEETPEMPKE